MQHFSCRTVAELALPGLATGRLTVLALFGDADSGADLDTVLRAPGATQLVLDLSGLRRLSPAAARALYRFAEGSAEHGRMLFLAACPADAAAVLARTRQPGGPGCGLYATVTDALSVFLTSAAAPDGPHLRPYGVELRHELLAHALVTRAQGILMERYGLPHARSAAALLRAVGREHGLGTVRLAAALGQARPPRAHQPWFPGRIRLPPPVVGFVPAASGRPPPLPVFLDALRDAVCAITRTGMADVQLIDASDNTLWLESHCGPPTEFVNFFAVIDDTTTACGNAARKRRRVVVEDVATAPDFDETARAVMLAAHSRSLQCTPIPGPAGRPQGMVSTHHDQPGHAYTGDELGALDRVAREAGAWLDWYRTTTVRDALEDLHRRAQGRQGDGQGPV
ncbi:GAF domain-containing protein [Streptomyces sp. NPDC051896]|uniref:GAF domain-containing protein n=1 Tax=Streptomyces sp. NPDC051896 TaxID=3155416 RepID=UPI0034201BE2